MDADGKDDEEEQEQDLILRGQLYLAVAEANTGRRAARRRLKELQKTIPWAGEILKALQAGKSGLGWAERYPYFHASELLPHLAFHGGDNTKNIIASEFLFVPIFYDLAGLIRGSQNEDTFPIFLETEDNEIAEEKKADTDYTQGRHQAGA